MTEREKKNVKRGSGKKTGRAWVTTRLCKNKPSPKLSHLLGVWLVAVEAAAVGGLTRVKGKGHRLWSICWLRASDLCAVRDSLDNSTQWKWTLLSYRSVFLLSMCAPHHMNILYSPAGWTNTYRSECLHCKHNQHHYVFQTEPRINALCWCN